VFAYLLPGVLVDREKPAYSKAFCDAFTVLFNVVVAKTKSPRIEP
jgi:hypothetical protein